MFDSMRIRTKLVFTLAVPLLALVGFSSLVVRASAGDAADAEQRAAEIREQVALATASLGPGGVITALQAERAGEAVALLDIKVNLGAPGETNADRRVATDRAMDTFRAAVANEPASVQEIYRETVAALNDITAVRAGIDSYSGPRTMAAYGYVQTVFDRYSKVIDTAFDANSRTTLEVDDAALRTGAELIDLVARNKEVETLVTRELLLGWLTEGLDRSELDRVAGLRARAAVYDEDMRSRAIGGYAPLVEPLFGHEQLVAFRAAATDAVAGREFNAMRLLTYSSEGLVPFNTFSSGAAAVLRGDAQALRDGAEREAEDARSNQWVVLALAALTVVGAAALTIAAARSIRKPMQRLARDADDMAERRLPEMVRAILDTPPGEYVTMPEMEKVSAGGAREIGEVANALDTVQRSAAELATEQALLRRNIADSFVNLGRRNQNLVSRQLDAITEMERAESDPAELQKLFALDHLATRMRRNAESLLLLAGQEPHRQWSAPVALIDVLRGALGEVEDYERVSIVRLDSALVDGTDVADLTHLVAELLENALHFSPPGRDVEIVGRSIEGRFLLTIVDYGVGMSPDELERANLRLAGRESFTVPPSRYLGHYVVGAQAARLGVPVTLHDTPAGGVTARIDLSNVLADPATVGADPDDVIDLTAPSAPAATAVATPPKPAPLTARPAPRPAPRPLPRPSGPPAARPATARPAPAGPSTPTSPTRPKAPTAPAAASSAAPTAPTAPSAPRPAAPTTGRSLPDAAVPAATAPDVTVPDAGTTPSGYKRRVRGAQTPRTEVVTARGTGPAGDALASDAPSTADGMRTLLSGLQDGTRRGRAAAADETTTSEEHGA